MSMEVQNTFSLEEGSLKDFIYNDEDYTNYRQEYTEEIERYLNQKINVQIEKIGLNYYLKCEYGTFFLGEKPKGNPHLIILKNLYQLLNGWTNYISSNQEIYQKIYAIKYFEALKSKDFEYLKKEYKNFNINFLLIPIEMFLQNENILSNTTNRGYEQLLYYLNIYQNDGFNFDKNVELRYRMNMCNNKDDITSLYGDNENNYYIKRHMEEFKKYLLEIDYNINLKEGYNYLKENYSEELDNEYCLKLYKNCPRLFYLDDQFKLIAKSIKNKSEKIKLYNDKEINLVYHDYDIYNDIPVGVITKNGNIKDPFLLEYLRKNDLFVKLYKMYFKNYIKISPPEKQNIKDFIDYLLLNKKTFIRIINNMNFTISEVDQFISLKQYLSIENQNKFDEFFRIYQKNERERWIEIHNELVKNPKEKSQILAKYNLDNDNSYKIVLENKFINKDIKSYILENMNLNCLRVIDIIELIDEMQEKKLTIDEMLKEKDISKKSFDKLYNECLKKNPFLYNYIKDGLSKNKKRGFYKLIRLGYVVLKSDIKTEEEYNEKFLNIIEFEKLRSSLINTELREKLDELYNSWNKTKVIK